MIFMLILICQGRLVYKKNHPSGILSPSGTFLDALLPALRVAGKSLIKEAHVDDPGPFGH